MPPTLAQLVDCTAGDSSKRRQARVARNMSYKRLRRCQVVGDALQLGDGFVKQRVASEEIVDPGRVDVVEIVNILLQAYSKTSRCYLSLLGRRGLQHREHRVYILGEDRIVAFDVDAERQMLGEHVRGIGVHTEIPRNIYAADYRDKQRHKKNPAAVAVREG